MSVSSLTGVLEAIQRADIPANERRRLGARAVEAALRLLAAAAEAAVSDPSVVEPRRHFEEALVAVQEAAQSKEMFNVVKAKAWLREQGLAGKGLASRLGRLSKARNATSHPDVSLLREIRCLHAQDGAASFDDKLVDGRLLIVPAASEPMEPEEESSVHGLITSDMCVQTDPGDRIFQTTWESQEGGIEVPVSQPVFVSMLEPAINNSKAGKTAEEFAAAAGQAAREAAFAAEAAALEATVRAERERLEAADRDAAEAAARDGERDENEIDENDAVLLLKLFHPLTGLFAQHATAGKPLRIDEALETLSAEEAERAKAVLSAWGYSTKLGLA